jgi:guanylate kinase
MGKRTLVTLTGMTCSGKSYLLDFLNKTGDFKKIPTFTSRAPRVGEQDTIDYFFVSDEHVRKIDLDHGFIELIQFGKYFYGMTRSHLSAVINTGKIPIIICTPEGVQKYEKYCKENDIIHVKGFVWVDEQTRMDRFENRIVENIQNDVSSMALKKTISENINRCRHMYITEMNWFGMDKWDVLLPGDNPTNAQNMLLKKISMMHESMI